jgi:RNA polymerase sigma-70 factor (ECF subfamily)
MLLPPSDQEGKSDTVQGGAGRAVFRAMSIFGRIGSYCKTNRCSRMTRPSEDRELSPPTSESVEAFVSLIGQYQRQLNLFVASLVPHPTDVEDILQETNLVLWREFHRFVPGTNFLAWASTVAFHQVLAWRKRQQRDRLVFGEAFLTAVSTELTDAADRLDDRARALAGCVEWLPPHHRDLLRLRYAEGGTVEGIAARLGRTTEAVYRMLSRIRQALYECVTNTLASEGTR